MSSRVLSESSVLNSNESISDNSCNIDKINNSHLDNNISPTLADAQFIENQSEYGNSSDSRSNNTLNLNDQSCNRSTTKLNSSLIEHDQFKNSSKYKEKIIKKPWYSVSVRY